MASFLRPLGPLPPSVYWRRRAVVFGIPLVLILAVAYSCSGSSSKPVAHTSNTPTAGGSPTGSGVIAPSVMPSGSAPPGNSYPTAGPTGSGGGVGGGTPGSGSSGSAGTGSSAGAGSGQNSGTGSGGGGECALTLTLTLDKTASNGVVTYSSGQDPKFIVTAQDSGQGNCGLDVSGKGIVITITDTATGAAVVWASNVCSSASDQRELGPGDSYQGTTTWPRTRSDSTCSQTPPSAGIGTYEVTAAADGVTTASRQFVLQ